MLLPIRRLMLILSLSVILCVLPVADTVGEDGLKQPVGGGLYMELWNGRNIHAVPVWGSVASDVDE